MPHSLFSVRNSTVGSESPISLKWLHLQVKHSEIVSSLSHIFHCAPLTETPSFLRPLMDRTVAKGETAVLQCIAGGSPPPKLNWTKDDSPLVVTERHFFAAANQLLIIVDTAESDAGKYTCEMSNTLGTERGNVRLAVIPNPNCDSGGQGGVGVGFVGSAGSDNDGWTTVGIVIIAVVCCVVGTSLVWVVIIYHTRRRNEDCSVTNTGWFMEAFFGFGILFCWDKQDSLNHTNTAAPPFLLSTILVQLTSEIHDVKCCLCSSDETNLPADIPSYLSSQGTLADRQDGYIPSESGSSHQYMPSSISGFYMQAKDMNGKKMCLSSSWIFNSFYMHVFFSQDTVSSPSQASVNLIQEVKQTSRLPSILCSAIIKVRLAHCFIGITCIRLTQQKSSQVCSNYPYRKMFLRSLFYMVPMHDV